MQIRKLKQHLGNPLFNFENSNDKLIINNKHFLFFVVDSNSIQDQFPDHILKLHFPRYGDELLQLRNQLQIMIDSKEIIDYLEKDDVIENPIPIFVCVNGQMFETETDDDFLLSKEGVFLPNTTVFKSRNEAVNFCVDFCKKRISELETEKEKLQEAFNQAAVTMIDYELKLKNLENHEK